MKKKIINFLCAAFPFIAVLVLWRLAVPFWNPAGILAMIPIFIVLLYVLYHGLHRLHCCFVFN